jgi:hypothetical protein
MNLRHLAISLVASGAVTIVAAACTIEGEPDFDSPQGKTEDQVKETKDAGAPKVETANGLPCDVDAVLKTNCQTCHASEPKFGASVPLVTHADLMKAGPGASSNKKVYELVKERIGDDARPMPPSPKPRLDAASKSVIDAWITSGAKSSKETCTTNAPEDGVKKLSCKPDTLLKASKPFTMQPNTPLDQYVCFGVDINLQKKRHVTALAPIVDNKQIVHHILLFQTDKAEKNEPFPCGAFGSAAWKLVAGWAPGGNNLELPPEAGFPEEVGTTHWVLQIHYNNATAKTGTDQSGYELCTTEELRPNDAGVLAFGSTNFNIPPRSNHTISCDYRLDARFSNVRMFNASPHMHELGAAMSTERVPGGKGTSEMLFEQKDFSFEAQANFPISKSVAPNDVLRTKCSWKNTTDKRVGFGEGTGDEMCFNFFGYYPKIPDKKIGNIPLFTWITPSQRATCRAQ